MQRFWVQSFPDPGRRRIKWRPADRVGYETSAHLQSLEGGRKQQRSALAAAASEAGSTAIAGPCCTGEPSLKGSSIESKSCHRAAQEGGDGTLA